MEKSQPVYRVQRGGSSTIRLEWRAPQKDLEAHAEDCILVPADADVAATREPVVFKDPKDDDQPSLGQQAGGESKQAVGIYFYLKRQGLHGSHWRQVGL